MNEHKKDSFQGTSQEQDLERKEKEERSPKPVGSKNIVIDSIAQFESMFDSNVKIIRLKGYSKSNKSGEYQEAKEPVNRWQSVKGLTDKEILNWINLGGWLGLVLPDNYDLIDIDEPVIAEIFYEALKAERIKFHAVKTRNGYHYYFRSSGKTGTQRIKHLTSSGVLVDYRLANRGYAVIPSNNISDRTWVNIEKTTLDLMPLYFEPMPKNLNKEEKYPGIPFREGGRNDKIFNWLSVVREAGKWDDDQIKTLGYFIAHYLCKPSYIETDGEDALNETINSVLSKQPSGNDYENSTLTIPGLTSDLSILKNKPGPQETVMPYGWKIKDDTKALYKTSGKVPELTSHSPLLVIGGFENLTDKTQGLVVAYFKNNKWYTTHQNRDIFMTQNKLTELASIGFPVSSNNARKIIGYIEDYEAVNSNKLPFYRVSEQLGFVENGFLIGNTFITENGIEINRMTEGSVSFSGADKGDDQFIEGFSTSGTLEGWLEAVEKIKEYPRLLMGIFASFASVLAPIVKSSLFIYELAGETSKGKTIALRTFASVWGNPDEVDGGIVRKWNTTPVNLERMAGVVNHLPLFLDDTKEANERYLSQSIYQLSSGQGRGRGSVKGTQLTKRWRNVIFSTGEQKITTFSKDGGTAGRTISIIGLPFGTVNKETYQTVHELDAAVKENYGHAGREFIKYLLRNKNQWSDIKATWETYREHFVSKVSDVNSVAGRLAGYMALIGVAAELFTIIFTVSWDIAEPLEILWDEIIRDSVETDRPLEAIRDFYSHIQANQAYFNKNEYQENQATIWGDWFYTDSQWSEVNIFPSIFEQEISKLGYEPKSILKSWFDRGWLITSKNRGYKKQMRMREGRVDFISIKREALSQ